MIEFLTLLLGLSAGPQTVAVSAGEETAEVRLLLDGVIEAIDEAPPWTLAFDLGPTLRPHLLEAVAFDADGNETGRAEQRLNLPRPPAEARLLLERNADGLATAARLSWESSVRQSPLQTRVWLDDEPVDVQEPSRIPLPPHDASQFHLLRAELEFSSDVIAEVQLAFGGTYLDEARTDLTALPVLASGKSSKVAPAQMAGWFHIEGESPRVVAFEKGGLDLVVVRGPGVGPALRSLAGRPEERAAYAGGAGNLVSLGVVASADQRLQEMMALEPGRRLRLLVPEARSQSGRSVRMALFALSPEITPEHGGLYRALHQDLVLPGSSKAVRLADAVAVAGLQAASGNRRRAVLLVLAAEAIDESRHSVAAARDYLAALHVPLLIWRIGQEDQGSWPQWGSGEQIGDLRDLRRAARLLKEALAHQRVVWLDGRHLPNTIRIGPRAKVQAVVPAASDGQRKRTG